MIYSLFQRLLLLYLLATTINEDLICFVLLYNKKKCTKTRFFYSLLSDFLHNSLTCSHLLNSCVKPPSLLLSFLIFLSFSLLLLFLLVTRVFNPLPTCNAGWRSMHSCCCCCNKKKSKQNTSSHIYLPQFANVLYLQCSSQPSVFFVVLTVVVVVVFVVIILVVGFTKRKTSSFNGALLEKYSCYTCFHNSDSPSLSHLAHSKYGALMCVFV